MYTNYFSFIEKQDEDYYHGLEELDSILATHKGNVKTVTHQAIAIKEGIKHYFTIFLEEDL